MSAQLPEHLHGESISNLVNVDHQMVIWLLNLQSHVIAQKKHASQHAMSHTPPETSMQMLYFAQAAAGGGAAAAADTTVHVLLSAAGPALTPALPGDAIQAWVSRIISL
jgi:hypothetical protein